ncbi:hypothetical protein Poli38472_010026 [Pythium oligandrum]|uniref:SnoaL-like domain-containing protein n=1 Tax=Pythium oligandrum TaxID=41045 RepID=A0A8K1C9M0_PYTOL|nr:hypothetical protein Poli38472_010026 [Pythium oligandrum]|eukprot:TMW58467.1 hypothetical protein Poli38472_010026 [Pythium oligandrum]
MATRSAQELAESILSLYDVSTPTDEIIARLYQPDAVFTDPIVQVAGIENIQAQFRSLPKFIKSSKATLVRGSMAGSAVLTIDSSMVYRLKPFPSWMKVTLRVFTVIELKNGRIATHTDHFDFYSVFANVPFVSFFYSHFRPMFGQASSAVIRKLFPSAVPAQAGVKKAIETNGTKQATATAVH